MIRPDGISVTELNRMISEGIRRAPGLRNVTVTAEVSGFKHHLPSGHWYFSLKDPGAVISCVMFRQNNIHAACKPADGDRVTIDGDVEFYSRDGKIQLYVTRMRPAGTGSILENLEILKKKLAAEGLFDRERKKILPLFPGKVAVITSPSGAALHDILNVSGHRCPGIPIVIVPCQVQGAGAGDEIAAAVRRASGIDGVEVIILARGGGSMEDLWCFNEEAVVRAVAECPIPLVSGVGHETDTTLCDYAADFRASTPSNAAEVVFPDREELRGRITYLRREMMKAAEGKLSSLQLELSGKRAALQRLSPELTLQRLSSRSRENRNKMESVLMQRIQGQASVLDGQRTEMEKGMLLALAQKENLLQNLHTRIHAISPLNVLQRGYALVYGEENHVVPDAETAGRQENMSIRFRDGTVRVRREEMN